MFKHLVLFTISTIFLLVSVLLLAVAVFTGGFTDGQIVKIQQVNAPTAVHGFELEIYVNWKPGWLDQLWQQAESKIYITKDNVYLDKDTQQPVSNSIANFLTGAGIDYINNLKNR